MRIRTTILAAALLGAAEFSPAAAASFSIDYGMTYQERPFSSGGTKYDVRQLQFYLQPRVGLGKGWRVFLRIGYSNLDYDSPGQGERSYNRWGYTWGGGLGWTPWSWSGFYLDSEADFFQTRTSGSSRRGEYLNWGADLRLGWDPGPVDVCLGFAYDDGVVRDEFLDDYSKDSYRLRDPWNLFAGLRLNLPVLPRLQARYYFWKDSLAVLGFSHEF